VVFTSFVFRSISMQKEATFVRGCKRQGECEIICTSYSKRCKAPRAQNRWAPCNPLALEPTPDMLPRLTLKSRKNKHKTTREPHGPKPFFLSLRRRVILWSYPC